MKIFSLVALMHKTLRMMLLLFLSLSATFLYGYTVDDFFDNPLRQKIEDEPMFVGEKRIITADDGIEFHMYQLNPCYEEPNFRHAGNAVVYFVLCPEENHILFNVFVLNDLFVEGKYDYTFTVTKDRDFKNVTLYSAFISYKSSDGEVITPVNDRFVTDRNGNDKYCGDDGLPSIELAYVEKETKETREYYNAMEDFIIYDVEDIMSRARETVFGGKVFFSSYIPNILEIFMVFNPDSREGLQYEIDELKLMEKIIQDNRMKISRLSLYSSPVSEATKYLLWNLQHDENLPDRPNIKGDLPTNEEELAIYLGMD